jgi:hypothetical protein
MPSPSPARPTHLSLFALDSQNGTPVPRLPLYAEVAVPRIVPLLPAEPRFHEPIRAALLAIDPSASSAVRDRVERAAQQALTESVDDAIRAALVTDPEKVKRLFERVFRDVLQTAGRQRLAEIAPAELKPRIIAALELAAEGFELGTISSPDESDVIWAEPLGVLVTDHVGYASFDLTRLRPDVYHQLAAAIDARRDDPDAVLAVAIWIHPYGYPGRFDALAQARFAFDAVVARLPVHVLGLPPAIVNMGPRALQKPSLTDWRLSAASFAASPKSLVGEHGCEELVPSNLALHEFVLRQVVRLSDRLPDITVPETYKPAYVDEYKVSWFSLGHSLGEILYSLPLAPGETVKLAVVDWSWDSLTRRDEQTRLTENVLHQTHRDRTITETVKAGLQELQHGSSFMGGLANAVGGSAQIGPVAMTVGHAWNLGGSTATSDGSRDVVAENVQRLNDSFSQASSAQREINSTIVIQARQEEKESIQTRTFSNYNHSHTLTILYYEVLRHYRVVVEWMRRRPAILAKVPARIATFDAAAIIGHRFLLEAALLDPSLKPAFDTLEKQEAIREHQTLHNIATSDTPGQPFWEGNVEFHMFEIGIRTRESAEIIGDDTTSSVVVGYIITADQGLNEKRLELHYVYKGLGPEVPYLAHNLNNGDRFDADSTQWTFVKPFDQITRQYVTVKWKDIAGFQFEKWGTNDWRIDALAINAFGLHGWVTGLTTPEVLRDIDLYFLGKEPSSQSFTWINRPGPVPAPLPPTRSPEKSLTQEERHQINKLLDHFSRNSAYYNRIVLFATDPSSIAIDFESDSWLVANAEPNPLEVAGSYVVYPLAKQPQVDDTLVADISAAQNSPDPVKRQWAADTLAALPAAKREQVKERLALAAVKSERLITLPTRGVFAEGKLGHCNISEEIDNTKFWKWEEHPIPIEAPGINPVTPIQPQPQQVPVAPTPFPQSLVNIVNPSPAPDPTGLAAALTLLGTPNIFRDMSGRAEVADLLKGLANDAVSMAQAAQRARSILSKEGAASIAGGGGGGTPGAGSGGTAAGTGTTPTPSPSEQLDQMQVVRSAVREGELTPEEGRQEVKKILTKPEPGTAAGRITLADNGATLRSFLSHHDKTGKITLNAQVAPGTPAITKVDWAVTGRDVLIKELPNFAAEIAALSIGGLADLTVRGLDASGSEIGRVATKLSVPQFFSIGAASDLDAAISSWNLPAGGRTRVLQIADKTVEALFATTNVRVLWALPPMSEPLPAQFYSGGLLNHLTAYHLDLAHSPAATTLITSSPPDRLMNLGFLTSLPGTGASITALATKLGTLAAVPTSLANLTEEIIGSTIGYWIAAWIASTVLNAPMPTTSTLVEQTGYTVAAGADLSDVATYNAIAHVAPRLPSGVTEQCGAKLPMPPTFT